MRQHLSECFGADGPLERALPDFRVRPSQRLMAERVAEAIADRSTLIVEAGTGTGKTFAYLVPALLSGARVLVSTGTRTLQDQLFAKDLPLLAAALGRPARVALLKGRSNYLCRERLLSSGAAAQGGGTGTLALLEDTRPGASLRQRIEHWALHTRRGDLAEVRELSDADPIWSQVTSTRENCLGARCAHLSRCHVAQARREALESDLVIVNHHLLLADLALKQDGFGDLLGAADAVILDEAHQIPDLATQFFGNSVGSRQIEHLLTDAHALVARALAGTGPESAARAVAQGFAAALKAVEHELRELGALLPTQPGRWAFEDAGARLPQGMRSLASALEGLGAASGGGGALSASPDEAADRAAGALGERAADIAGRLSNLAEVDALEGARALERHSRGWTVSLVPFDIAARFRELVQSRRCAWIFTSATLSVGGDFGHFAGRLGLEDTPTLQIESPFDYAQQGLLLLPPGMPDPASPAFLPRMLDLALELVAAAQGGAFILFTSHRALSQAAAQLRARRFETQLGTRLLVQGEAPRERLLAEFRAHGGAVLLGTSSFWEGVDVKGDALRLVVIEKLPFASPEDPLVRARIDHLRSSGGNPFRDYQLPEAALMLKQGVGRLIRSETDAGVVVLCDPRITGRGYGRVFLAAMPPLTVTRDPAEACAFLARGAARMPLRAPA